MKSTFNDWRKKVTTATKWIIGVSGSVVSTIAVVLILLWAGHFEATAETGRTAEETKQITDDLVTVVEGLVSIHDVDAAGLVKTAEFCNSGMISDCKICAEAGVALEKCTK